MLLLLEGGWLRLEVMLLEGGWDWIMDYMIELFDVGSGGYEEVHWVYRGSLY